MWNPPPDHPLRRLFAGVTEATFQTRFGVADPDLIDYLSALLSRFVHVDAVHRLRDAAGRRLDRVVDMVAEAAALPPGGRTAREVHRHIGDFTLFWTGVYPEMLQRLRNALSKDQLIDYQEQGKRSYYIASTYETEPYQAEAPVLLVDFEGGDGSYVGPQKRSVTDKAGVEMLFLTSDGKLRVARSGRDLKDPDREKREQGWQEWLRKVEQDTLQSKNRAPGENPGVPGGGRQDR